MNLHEANEEVHKYRWLDVYQPFVVVIADERFTNAVSHVSRSSGPEGGKYINHDYILPSVDTKFT